ncbi:hypothetical protein [Rhizobium ruizarguesonis]|uniref:hypothetical protein n=1 Tax=Rhizobium ruizarguesonis TaxID=2081791 RepID=UPI0013C0BC44|nr:hypothetical protein [Rhizobium ruizarguesonis]NEH32653.1 hypothetical protein [Rhizobium ruizarguesonis]NEK07473.1 hypothetical protein [Rhizobium ruizarguesonis]
MFIVVVGIVTIPGIIADFRAASFMKSLSNDTLMVPIICDQARGTLTTDYSPERAQADVNPFDTCWYELPKFRTLYPEYKDLSDDDLTDKLYERRNIPINRNVPQPWLSLARAIAFAVGGPLSVLLIGGAFVWAFSGFSRPKAS